MAKGTGIPYLENYYPQRYSLPANYTLPCYPGIYSPFPTPGFPFCPASPHPILHTPLLQIQPPAYPTDDHLGADITMATKQDEDGDTALHIAVVQENPQVVLKLIKLFRLGKKELDIYNNLRQTPLHLAVITKQPYIVAALAAEGASPMLLDRNGKTAIHLACEHGSLDCLLQIMKNSRESLNLEARNYEGYCPLHIAVANGNQEIVTYLLDHGADIDSVGCVCMFACVRVCVCMRVSTYRDVKSGQTPLIQAVEINSIEMVTLMIQSGANVNAQTYSGNTALHCASGRGLVDMVRLLLKNGADSSAKNYHNDTALMVAKNKRVIDALRGRGTRPALSTTLKIPEIPKEAVSPQSSSSNSNGLESMSPSSGPRPSPIATFQNPPITPSPVLAPPHSSASSQSSETQPFQPLRSSPASANH
uniref:BCL3 transcription coactivator n=1 Tax=Latimeria chalumnae TaxID=7897 RepID=H3AVQ6_LATCH